VASLASLLSSTTTHERRITTIAIEDFANFFLEWRAWHTVCPGFRHVSTNAHICSVHLTFGIARCYIALRGTKSVTDQVRSCHCAIVTRRKEYRFFPTRDQSPLCPKINCQHGHHQCFAKAGRPFWASSAARQRLVRGGWSSSRGFSTIVKRKNCQHIILSPFLVDSQKHTSQSEWVMNCRRQTNQSCS
jgi:hypothetical protein